MKMIRRWVRYYQSEGCQAFKISSTSVLRRWINQYTSDRTLRSTGGPTTLKKAFLANRGAQPFIHSDRGFQYTSREYARFTASHHVLRSMSRGSAAALITCQWKASGATIRRRPMIGGNSQVIKSWLPQSTSTFTFTTISGTKQN